MKIRTFPEHNYRGIFHNGNTFRIALDPSKPITELDYPEFYDVKITDKCEGKCPYCYMDSLPTKGHFDNVVDKIQQFFGTMTENQKPFQVAIGGGEPTEAPYFSDVLETFHSLGIVPNYTTNGMFVRHGSSFIYKIIGATQRYCDGVAVSCHKHLEEYWTKAVDELHLFKSNFKINLHIVISDDVSINYFRKVFERFKEKIDFCVLLPYASQGRAKPKEIDWDFLVANMPKEIEKIAFGAGFYPYLKENPGLFKVSL